MSYTFEPTSTTYIPHLTSINVQVRLMPCFRRGVATTLSQGWETGAVIEEEVKPNGRWSVGPCSSDGSLRRR